MGVDRLAGMQGIGVDRLGAAADGLMRADILRLENLDTDLRPPDVAIAATAAAIEADDANSYLPFIGQSRLRQAVAAHVGRLSHQPVDWETQVAITAGGLNGVLVTLLAVTEPGDEVIMTDPTYIGMINRVRLAGAVPKLVPFVRDGAEWRLDLDALASAVGPRTRALFLMNPSMPSGAALNDADWDAVATLCAERDLLLLYNAAMERILYDGRAHIHPASLPGLAERTITIGSASKEFRMIGWRVGWIVCPPALIERVALVQISDVVVPVGIAQGAVAMALEADSAGAAGVAEAVAEWQRRRDAIAVEIEPDLLMPAAGSWSMLLDAGKAGLSGEEASARLLQQADIAATPMINWGVVNGPQFVRLVFSNEPVRRLAGIGARIHRALDMG
ncbi:MAG: pyridoxal phosphate-dependent aminotransferase [Alphaproteobacteria bacterium]